MVYGGYITAMPFYDCKYSKYRRYQVMIIRKEIRVQKGNQAEIDYEIE